MKKNFFILFCFLGILVIFSGCSTANKNQSSGPGSVLGPPSGETENQKIVSFFVIGKGLEPENALSKGEAVIMAERAAVADGYRKLVEKIRGVYVDAYMRAGNGTVNYDTIQTHTQSWLRGTEVLEISQGEYGITNARMRLRINFAKRGMVWWPVGLGGDMKPSRPATPVASSGTI